MRSLADSTVLVTGAGGFLGSHVVEALVSAGARVRAFVRYNARDSWGLLEDLDAHVLDRITVVAGDIRDASLVQDAVAGCDVVLHLAALIGIPYSYRAPRSYIETNVTGSLNVLEACLSHDVRRIVHTSTSEVYGSAQAERMTEAHPLVAQSPYAASKIAADKLAESYHRCFDLPVVTLRPFNSYGPRQSARAIIPTIISQASRRDTVELGALSPIRDLTYASDTARAFLAAASAPGIEGRTFHVGSGIGTRIADLAERVLHLMGRHGECSVVSVPERERPAASEVERLICDAAPARDALDWRPMRDLDEGLKRTIEFVTAHPNRYRVGRYAT